MKWLRGWTPALRIAWREAWRAKGRSLLVLFMIALPVGGATVADVLIYTSEISGLERIDDRLGAADARLDFRGTTILQSPDGREDYPTTKGMPRDRPDLSDVRTVLGREVPAMEVESSYFRIDTGSKVIATEAQELDLANPLATGLFRMASGTIPDTPLEVAVSPHFVAAGVEIGEEVSVIGGKPLRVTGVLSRAEYSGRDVVVSPGTLAGLGLGPEPERDFAGFTLLGGGDVTWSDVQKLNQIGYLVESRAVLAEPPQNYSRGDYVEGMVDYRTRERRALLAGVGLAIVMGVLEIALLAGPAIAVGAKRQARTIALLRIAGGTPRDSQRIVLSSALVLGAMGALIGMLAGVAIASGVTAYEATHGRWHYGPLDIRMLQVAGLGLAGVLSALIAAAVPARIAARQVPMALMRGRNAHRPVAPWIAWAGVGLIAGGLLAAAWGVRMPPYSAKGPLLIAGAAVILVLGLIVVLPTILQAAASLASNAGVPLRYAGREAARHLTRTVPAVAAVAGTVIGVVTIGVVTASEQASYNGTYDQAPWTKPGVAVVSLYAPQPSDWAAVSDAIKSRHPDAAIEPIRSVRLPDDADTGVTVYFREPTPENRAAAEYVFSEGTYSLAARSGVIVSDAGVPDFVPGLTASNRAEAQRALRNGQAVVFADHPVAEDEVTIAVEETSTDDGPATKLAEVTVPAVFVVNRHHGLGAQAVLPESLVEKLGLAIDQSGAVIDGADLSSADRKAIRYAANRTVGSGYLSYWRTNVPSPPPLRNNYAILAAIALAVMLVGTLTATSLALADAKNDLAVLSAVGASPGRARWVSASFALIVALTGAVCGVVLGLVTGLASAATEAEATMEGVASLGALAVPWLLIAAIVVLLPLLSAAVAAVVVRPSTVLTTRLE